MLPGMPCIHLPDQPMGNQPVIKHIMQPMCAVLYQATYKTAHIEIGRAHV